jgi:hypothetical protein
MPRSEQWRKTTFKTHPVELDPRARREIAQYLGLESLPDNAAAGIAFTLGAHQPKEWRGSTPRGDATRLRRLAESLRSVRVKMRAQFSGSYSLINDETAEQLFNDGEALATAMQGFCERLLTRAATLDEMSPVRPKHEARVMTVGYLRLTFQEFATPHVRDNEANLRGFVIACLDNGGIEASDLKEHPDRLRAMLQVKVPLPTPDWPRTRAVLA